MGCATLQHFFLASTLSDYSFILASLPSTPSWRILQIKKKKKKNKGDEGLGSPNSTVESATDTTEVSSSKGDQSSNDTQ